MTGAIDREPITELKEVKALLCAGILYHYNYALHIISSYQLLDSGFAYSVVRYSPEDFYKMLNFIWLLKAGVIYRASEIGEQQYSEIVNQLAVLQEQGSSLKPLVTHEAYFDLMRQKFGIRVK